MIARDGAGRLADLIEPLGLRKPPEQPAKSRLSLDGNSPGLVLTDPGRLEDAAAQFRWSSRLRLDDTSASRAPERIQTRAGVRRLVRL